MKRINAIIIISITLVMFGCDGSAGSPGITDNEILIGNVQDLSGPMKELGQIIPAGSNLYFDHVNNNGGVHGRKIRMLVEDAEYNPQKTVAAVKKLIEKEQVFCLYNVIGTSPTEAIRPLLAESGIPLIAPATQSGTMSDMSRPAAEYSAFPARAVLCLRLCLRRLSGEFAVRCLPEGQSGVRSQVYGNAESRRHASA